MYVARLFFSILGSIPVICIRVGGGGRGGRGMGSHGA